MRSTACRISVEIKARCKDLGRVRKILVEAGAVSPGIDPQVDTYFTVPHGRLKVREGAIENALIGYHRPDDRGPKTSAIGLMELTPGGAKEITRVLEAALGVKKRVVKRREIFFVENVKFHLDEVEGLGRFVEIEALSTGGVESREALERQARSWIERLALDPDDFVTGSYSDLLG